MPHQITALIFTLSLVGRQIMEAIRLVLPLPLIKVMCAAVFALVIIWIFWVALKRKKYFLIPLIVLYGFAANAMVEAPQELLHFIYFGALGASCRKNTKTFEGIFIVILVSICDELIQKILPYRTYELRDILMNLAGGTMGYLGVTLLPSLVRVKK